MKCIRILSAVLFLAVSIGIFSVHAAAEQDTENLSPDTEDTVVTEAVSFPDVPPQVWFYDEVTTLAEKGIINGFPDGLFHPDQEITNAEFIKILMLSVGANLSTTPTLRLFSEHWATDYISLAYEQGILTEEDLTADFDPSAPVTRSGMTKMMILALGIEPSRIDDPFTDISDIYASTAYKEYLLRGYLLEDDTRVYRGDDNAMRSEAATIAVRVLEYREDPESYKTKEILDNASVNPLNSESELLDLFYVINREFLTSFAFESTVSLEDCMSYYLHANVIHLEYFYSSRVNFKFFPKEKRYEIALEYDLGVERLQALHTAAKEKADQIIKSIITDGMSSLDKIKAIHDYLILNCTYDYNNYIAGTIALESRLAYGPLVNQSAICQGYCAAFNLLCERAGIRSIAINGFAPSSSDEHAWNMLLSDGQIYYVDVTHDDPVPDQKGHISYKYYYLTEAEMTALGYTWDKNQSNLKYLY